MAALIASFFAGIGSILAWTLKLLRHVKVDGPTRKEVQVMIEKQAPYVGDRRLIVETLRENQKQIRVLVKSVAQLTGSEAERERRLGQVEGDLRELLRRSRNRTTDEPRPDGR